MPPALSQVWRLVKPRYLRAILGVALATLFWWLIPTRGNVLFPPLPEILTALVENARAGTLARDILHSSLRVLLGVCASVSATVVLAVVALADRRAVDLISGVVEWMRPIPPIAWTPVAIILFGIGWAPAIAIVAVSSFFPLWLSVLHGIDSIQEAHLRSARCLGANRWILFTDVQFPSLLPAALQGLRLAIGIGWFSVIAAEMVGASTGLGHAVQNTALNLEMDKTYGYLLVIGAIGGLVSWTMSALVRRLTGGRNAILAQT